MQVARINPLPSSRCFSRFSLARELRRKSPFLEENEREGKKGGRMVREKQEKALLIEELSINVYTRKGIIFSARRTTDSTLPFSYSYFSVSFPLFTGKTWKVFALDFLAPRLLIVLDAGIDNAGVVGIRMSIISPRGEFVWSRMGFRGLKNGGQLFIRKWWSLKIV